MQFRGTPHWQFAKSPHHQRGIIIARDISAGHKERHALAWWPGFLPFTLDGTTLNTEKFQNAVNDPHTTVKYRTWRYYASISNYYTDNADNLVEVESSVELTLTFDAVYGDLSSATAQRIFTVNGVGNAGFADYDYTWTRADGLFADSDIAPLVNPDVAAWGYMSGSDVMIDNHARASPPITESGHGTIPSAGIVTLDATELVWNDEADYDPGFALGTDGHYILTTSITLSAGYTYLAAADDAKEMLPGITMRPRNDELPMFYWGAGSITMAEWRDPATYTFTTAFCFWGDANDLVTMGDATSACNMACRVYNRHAAAAITLNLELYQYSGQIVSYGCFNGDYVLPLFTMSAPTDWWDEPEYQLAVKASESLLNLETGLSDGNIVSVTDPLTGFPVNLYYDFEVVLAQDDDGGLTTAAAGVYDVGVGVRSFLVPELQTQLAGLGKNYGSGWCPRDPPLSRPASPY